MSRPAYHPLIERNDREIAEAFDEWAFNQDEGTRVSALCHVEAVKQQIPNLGEIGAKALVFTLYAEVLQVEKI